MRQLLLHLSAIIALRNENRSYNCVMNEPRNRIIIALRNENRSYNCSQAWGFLLIIIALRNENRSYNICGLVR